MQWQNSHFLKTGSSMLSHIMEYCFFQDDIPYINDFDEVIQLFSPSIQKTERIDLYIHIPFCAQICTYCKLKKKQLEAGDMEQYISLLEHQAKKIFDLYGKIQISAVWFGGGTPSLMSPAQIRIVGDILHKYFNISSNYQHFFECHSTYLDTEKLQALKDIGINGLVIPTQTTNSEVLKKHNRFSNNYFSKLENIVSEAKKMWFFVSTDIIFGLEDNALKDEIYAFLYTQNLNYDEISVYTLQKNTKISSLEELQFFVKNSAKLRAFLQTIPQFNQNYCLIGNTSERSTYYFRKNLEVLDRYSPHIHTGWSILTLGTGVFGGVFWKARFSCKDIKPYQDPKFHIFSIDMRYEMLEFFLWRLDLYGELLKSDFSKVFLAEIEMVFDKELKMLHQQNIIRISETKIELGSDSFIKNVDIFAKIFKYHG